MKFRAPTTTLFRCEWVTNGPGRCAGGGTGVLAVLLVPLDSFKEGRLDEEGVGLIDEGGVMELWEVSIVEEDLPETASTLDDGLLESAGNWKLAFDRRRSCLRNGMVTVSELKPGTSRQEKKPALGAKEVAAVIGVERPFRNRKRDRLRRTTAPLRSPRKSSTRDDWGNAKREREEEEEEGKGKGEKKIGGA